MKMPALFTTLSLRSRRTGPAGAERLAESTGVGDVAGKRGEGPCVLSDVGWEMLCPESHPFERIFLMGVSIALVAPDAVYEDSILPDHTGDSYRGLDGFVRSGVRPELEVLID